MYASEQRAITRKQTKKGKGEQDVLELAVVKEQAAKMY